MDFQAHPFDLTYDQIQRHREVYSCPKGGLRNAFPVPRATLQKVFFSLSKKIYLHKDVWRQILKQFDQSTFDANFTQYDDINENQAVLSSINPVFFENKGSRELNVAEKEDLVLLTSKIEFSDFLRAIQKESMFRSILSEHQLYFHSIKRLAYKQDTRLISKQALEAISLAKQGGRITKVPSITYQIDNMQIFTFQGTRMLLIAFENKTVQVFEASNGHYAHEFQFYDKVFDSFGLKSDDDEEEKTEKKRIHQMISMATNSYSMGDQELEKSGLSKIEVSYLKRKRLREKGEFKPVIPAFTPMVKFNIQKESSLKAVKGKDDDTDTDSFLNNIMSSAGVKDEHCDQSIGSKHTVNISPKKMIALNFLETESPMGKDIIQEEDEDMDQTLRAPELQKIYSNQPPRSSGSPFSKYLRKMTRNEKMKNPMSIDDRKLQNMSPQAHKLSKQMSSVQDRTSMAKSLQRFNRKRMQKQESTILSSERQRFKKADSFKFSSINLKVVQQPSRDQSVFQDRMKRTTSRSKEYSISQISSRRKLSPADKNQNTSEKQKLEQLTTRELDHKSNTLIFSKFKFEMGKNVAYKLHDQRTLQIQQKERRIQELEAQTLKKIQDNIDMKEEQRRWQREVLNSKNQTKKTVAKPLSDDLSSDEVQKPVLQVKRNPDRIRTLRLEQQKKDREENKKRRARMRKMKMYGVLGLDPILPSESDPKAMADQGNMANHHSYGLDMKLFTPEFEKKEKEEGYNQVLKDIDTTIKINQNLLEQKKAYELKLSQRQRMSKLSSKRTVRIEDAGKRDCNQFIRQMKEQKYGLQIRIGKHKEKQRVFGEWISDFDEQQRQDLVQKPFGKKEDKVQQEHPPLKGNILGKADQCDRDIFEQVVAEKMDRTRIDLEKDKKKRDADMKISIQTEDFKKSKTQESKKTYPMCISYYEPQNLAVFGLVSREIQLHQLMQTGVRRTFMHIQSLRVENMIVQQSIGEHKLSSNVLLVVGTQSKNLKKSEVVAYILDPKFEFEVVESYRWLWPEEQITSVYYNSGCGLILSSFSGYMEIFDPVKINYSVWDNIKLQKKNGTQGQGGSISTVAYSTSLDFIAYGGVSGKIYVLDQTTKNQNGIIEAHKQEIILINFYDPQHQLISISQSGEIGLWDAQKLTKIQIIRNSSNMTQKIISTCCFYLTGQILLATTKIFTYELETDNEVKILTEQQNAIARDYLRGFFKQLEYAGVIKLADGQDDQPVQSSQFQEEESFHLSSKSKSGSNAGSKYSSPLGSPDASRLESTRIDSVRAKKKPSLKLSQVKKRRNFNYKGLSEQQYMQIGFEDQSIKDCIPPYKECNGCVLPCEGTKLVGMIFDPIEFVLYTIDSDLLMRVWEFSSGKCKRSYIVETRDDQIASANAIDGGDGNLRSQDAYGMKIEKKKAQLARSDSHNKFLIIALEGGEIQVNNLFTGALIYNNSTVEPIKIDFEIAQMRFFHSQTKFWIAASCWEGRVAFISRPQVSQGRNFLMFKKCKCSHQRDVITLDINSENQLVTGSVDNIICFWNSFNGLESKKVKVPEQIASIQKGQNIQYIKFPFPNKKDILLVVLNNGECYMLETQSEQFLKFNIQKRAGEDESETVDPNFCTSSDDEYSKESKLSCRRSTTTFQNFQEIEANKKQTFKKSYRAINPWMLGKIATFPTISIKSNYLLSVSEYGSGKLHSLVYNKSLEKKQTGRNGRKHNNTLSDIVSSNQSSSKDFFQQPISLEEFGSFNLEESGQSGNVVIQVEICLQHEIFIVAQTLGQVSIYSLLTCDRVCLLNKGIFDLPKRMSTFNKMNFKSMKTVNLSVWPDSLKKSQISNQDNFNSDVFQSIKKIHNRSKQSKLAKRNQQYGFASHMNILNEDQLAKSGVKDIVNSFGVKQPSGFMAAASTNYQTIQLQSQKESAVNLHNNIKSIQYLDPEGLKSDKNSSVIQSGNMTIQQNDD